VQRLEAVALIELAQARGKPVVVGGPDASNVPEAYAAAEFLVLDEGEMTIPLFLADLKGGARRGTYRSADKPDIARTPVPRFDLAELDRYLWVGVQFSRGCPFNCEFCDIIELYGRKPRTKTGAQVLRELDALHAMGYRGHVDFVDDNFIGNRRQVLAFLPDLLSWSREHAFPFWFSTEATINLADDTKLLDLMEAVDFRWVFVGIETPDERLLTITQKKQNLRHPVAESVRRLNGHGLIVAAGVILGFDGEDRGAARAIVDCVQAAGIATAMPTLLTALPNTQLTRRLAREGRLPEQYWAQRTDMTSDQMTGAGVLNFIPSRPRREVLEDFAWMLRQLYAPRAYFDRVLRSVTWLQHRPKHRGSGSHWLREQRSFPTLVRRLGFDPRTAWYFWRNFWKVLVTNPAKLEPLCHLMAQFLHYQEQTRWLLGVIDREVAALPPGEPPAATGRDALAREAAAPHAVGGDRWLSRASPRP
jgi:radical SAM superfamily enzyme YgiQ (UPF0313 family)